MTSILEVKNEKYTNFRPLSILVKNIKIFDKKSQETYKKTLGFGIVYWIF
jgi:hypothetical protein